VASGWGDDEADGGPAIDRPDLVVAERQVLRQAFIHTEGRPVLQDELGGSTDRREGLT
jgi:hypothetical protein